VGGGLLRSGPRQRARRRLGEQARQLRQPRLSRRHVPRLDLATADALAELIQAAEALAAIRERTGRDRPDVIT
jgi:hypothetical protein